MFEYLVKHGNRTWTEYAPNRFTLLDILNDKQIHDPEIYLLRRMDENARPNLSNIDSTTPANLSSRKNGGTGRNNSRDKTNAFSRQNKTPENAGIDDIVGNFTVGETITLTPEQLYELVGDTIDLGRQIKADFIVAMIDKQLAKIKPSFMAQFFRRGNKIAQKQALHNLRALILNETK